mgnify:CR=1 FL=1|jgi:hypothetical protein
MSRFVDTANKRRDDEGVSAFALNLRKEVDAYAA